MPNTVVNVRPIAELRNRSGDSSNHQKFSGDQAQINALANKVMQIQMPRNGRRSRLRRYTSPAAATRIGAPTAGWRKVSCQADRMARVEGW